MNAATKRTSQPLKWHGGKFYLAPRIIALMPEHKHYVEPYFGGGAVLLAKDPEGVSEVANDLNGELSNFWRVIANLTAFQEFQRKVETTPFSKFEWAESNRHHWGGTIGSCDPYDAWQFFVRFRQSRQGLGKDFATLSRNRTRRGMNEQVSSWLTAIEGLPEAHERLKRVVILNDDALNVIRQQDGPNTLFYLDPPYLHETRSSTGEYEHEMTEQQHVQLLGEIALIEGKFLLSGYRSELYDDIAEHCWRRVDFDLPNNASSRKTKERKTECVWMNF